MLLNVENALKNTGRSVGLSELREIPDFDFDRRHIAFAEPVRVEGTLMYDGSELTLRGTVHADTVTACDRCAAPTHVVIDAQVAEVFSKDAAADAYELDGSEIDIDRMAADVVAMEYPARVLCGEPGCEFTDIIEPPEEKDNPFYILKSVKSDDEEV